MAQFFFLFSPFYFFNFISTTVPLPFDLKMQSYSFKVVLLGEGCVGKTSLTLRYVRNEFNDSHITTIQASFLPKRVNVEGARVNLAIWDTAGQERFHALGPIYYRDADGALLVYDITDHQSFERVQSWVKELRKMLGKDIVLAIAGNKCDMAKERTVTREEAEEYAKQVSATHFETSAKKYINVDEVFLHLTEEMIKQAGGSSSGPKAAPGTGSGIVRPGRPGRGPIVGSGDLFEDPPESSAAQSKPCCD